MSDASHPLVVAAFHVLKSTWWFFGIVIAVRILKHVVGKFSNLRR